MTGKQKVVVLGASKNPDRYSNKAILMLRENGHEVIPVHPVETEIEGIKVINKLEQLQPGSVDTITFYVSPHLSSSLEEVIINLKPSRVIFNPGSENPKLIDSLPKAGIEVIQACTLVMLRTNQF